MHELTHALGFGSYLKATGQGGYGGTAFEVPLGQLGPLEVL